MKRVWHIWLAFAVCLALVLGALTWISVIALRLERSSRLADRQAGIEERIRLALWRVDSAMTPLITRESARPFYTFTAEYGIRPKTPISNRPDQNGPAVDQDVLIVSPLAVFQSPRIRLHFQLDPAGRLTSPQAPQTPLPPDVQPKIADARQRLERLRGVIKPAALLAALPAPDAPDMTEGLLAQANPQRNVSLNVGNRQPQAQGQAANRLEQQLHYNQSEWQARANTVQQAQNYDIQGKNLNNKDLLYTGWHTGEAVREGPLKAVWVGGELILARRVVNAGREYVQGCWLDWPAVQEWLLDSVRDLLPEARLVACAGGQGDINHPYMLATMPVSLSPGRVPHAPADDGSPTGLALLLGWWGVLLGALAVGLVLHGTIRLSERRGAFVSAVTHELRTPLTSFRLYADMLAGGMVQDEKKKGEYLRRLRDEADRLSHLVENVLAYARLSGPRRGQALEAVTLRELVEGSRERLAARAEQARMTLDVEAAPEDLERCVSASRSAVEQILLNLVDNACKYAGRAQDRRIHLRVQRQDGRALVRVCDHGPGVRRGDVFRPFHKSAAQAADSAPGIGLGLSLSRRLARDMGGELRLDADTSGGACFVLTLRLA